MTLSLLGRKNVLKRSSVSASISMAAPSALVGSNRVSSTVITHNLGYIPMVRIYFEQSETDGIVYPAGGNRLLTSYIGLGGTPIICLYEVDETTLTIYLETDGFSPKTGSRNVHYIIYKDF